MASGDNIFKEDDEEKIVQDIVSKLKFISKIQQNQIIDLRSFSIMEPCISTSLYRTCIRLGSENRENVLLFFTNIINSSLDLVTKYLNYDKDYYTNIALMIVSSLEKARGGIINFKKTYINDVMFCSKIETLIETLDIKYNNLKHYYLKRQSE